MTKFHRLSTILTLVLFGASCGGRAPEAPPEQPSAPGITHSEIEARFSSYEANLERLIRSASSRLRTDPAASSADPELARSLSEMRAVMGELGRRLEAMDQAALSQADLSGYEERVLTALGELKARQAATQPGATEEPFLDAMTAKLFEILGALGQIRQLQGEIHASTAGPQGAGFEEEERERSAGGVTASAALPASLEPGRGPGSAALSILKGAETIGAKVSGGGRRVDATLRFPGQKNRFTFDGTAGELVSVYVDNRTTGGETGMSVRMWGPDGKQVATHTTSCCNSDVAIHNELLPASGRYEIAIGGYGETTGDYTMTFFHPSFVRSAIVGGQGVEGSLDLAGEKRGYTFEGRAGQRVTVFVDNRTTTGDTGMWLWLGKADGTVLKQHRTNCCNADVSIHDYPLPEDGTYLFVVAGYGDTTGPYTAYLDHAGAARLSSN